MKKTHHWLFWDWKSISRTILLFSGLLLLFAFVFIFPDWNRDRQAVNYDGTTQGTISSIEPNEEISMSETGNKTAIYSYTICYDYRIGKQTYHGTSKLPGTIKIQKALNHLSNTDQVTVKYDTKNPRKSMIIF
ncbi:DUF3592 domain-containing protein [Fluviicola sp.]|uniref:DUF3592 domain-containing protein n=1 Tax=Fluviicola sp. TaxID=1917219 RepID=UPI0031D394A7